MDNHTHPAGDLPKPPRVLSATEMYDALMGEIEPDLVSHNVLTLTEKYKEESPEERAKRAERYTNAFAAYEERLRRYQEEWNMQLKTFKRLAVSYIEGKDRAGESPDIEHLETSLSS